MSARHTPGPWRVDGPPWNQIIWSDADNRVCFMAHSSGLDDERDIATAHLVAAAPDLLQVALMVKEASELSGVNGPLADAARAAIAKTTPSDHSAGEGVGVQTGGVG